MERVYLNLFSILAQIDVVRKILSLLTEVDMKIIFIAHNKKWEHLLVKRDPNFCDQLAKEGYTSLLIWAKDKGCEFSSKTAICAALNGHLETLKTLRDLGCPWDKNVTSSAAKGNDSNQITNDLNQIIIN